MENKMELRLTLYLTQSFLPVAQFYFVAFIPQYVAKKRDW